MKKNHILSIALVVFASTSCGPQPSSNYVVPQQISEPIIAEITPTFETQIERVNNCDGANPTYNVSYKTIETQKATFEVTVGAGGLVTGTPIPSALEVQLEAKITAALAKDYGLTIEKDHDITLDNPKGTYLEHTIEWKVTRVKGLIEVIYGDDVAQVVFEKIADVEFYNRTSQPLDCNGHSESQFPTPTDSGIEPDQESQEFSIWSMEEDGVRVDINTTGVYKISYKTDAYSPWPNEQFSDYQGWTTILRIYINRPVEWGTTEYGLVGPINHDHYLGPGGYYLDKDDAISTSKGDSRTLRLNKGDYLTIITLDEQGRYFDNRGKVDIDFAFLGSD